MATDTQLTNLVVNTLTRKQYHDADLTDHGDELFVQSDHAGVYVGTNGIDALDTTNISNCITEIPQDIKLELVGTTLTLKAGSKVYMPNGFEADGVTRKFDIITVASDESVTPGSSLTTGIYLLFYNGNTFDYYAMGGYIVSGATDPMAGQPWHMWYDTTNNIIKAYRDSGSDVARTQGFPIAELDVSNGVGVVSIRKIFNGFGYIGSTVFALPGVKGLMTNGFNADGTLKSTPVTFSSVLITNDCAQQTERCIIMYRNDGQFFSSPVRYYDKTVNYIRNKNTNALESGFILGYCNKGSGGKVSGFAPHTAFHAVDYNNTEFIGHQAMPSNKYVDLTVGASGSSYVAPADGYFVVAIADSGYAELTTTSTSSTASFIGGWARAFIPVKKGTVMTLYYGNVGTWKLFMFVYAQGAQ